MKHKKIIVLPLLITLLTSCIKADIPIADYFLDVETGDKLDNGYRILQLTDLHFNMGSNLTENQFFLDTLLYKARADYIVLTGDTFMDATLTEVEFAYSYFDKVGLPWSVVWGNHDKEGQFLKKELIDRLEECNNVKFIDHFNDNVYGDSNYAVNIKQNGITKWKLIMFDSNSYYFILGNPDLAYDSLHQDQIDWYKNVINYENGSNIPSLIFMHIPIEEYEIAFNSSTEIDGKNDDGVNYGSFNSGLFKEIKELGSTKGIFVGHDHVNNFAVNYENVVLSYGVKSSVNCYHDSYLGGQVITIDNSGDFTLNNIERIFINYEY